MKHTNSRFVVARLVLVALTLAITVFTFASCEGLPPELQGLLGGNPNASCEHTNVENCVCKDCNEPVHIIMQHVPYTPPACEQNGGYEFYNCPDCEGNFSDAEGKNELNTDIIIPALGHNYVDGVCDRYGTFD